MWVAPKPDHASRINDHYARIKDIAASQRHFAAFVAVLFLLHAATCLFAPLVLLLFVAPAYLAIMIARLMRTMGIAKRWQVIAIVGMFLPLVQLVVLIVVNFKACEILRAAGLKIGLLGVDEQEIAKFEEQQLYE